MFSTYFEIKIYLSDITKKKKKIHTHVCLLTCVVYILNFFSPHKFLYRALRTARNTSIIVYCDLRRNKHE